MEHYLTHLSRDMDVHHSSKFNFDLDYIDLKSENNAAQSVDTNTKLLN